VFQLPVAIMNVCKRILAILALFFGAVGLVASLAVIVAFWIVHARIDHATEEVFDAVDESVIAVRERVGQARDRVIESRITLEKVEKSLKQWTQREATERLTERLAERLEIAEKAERLASALQQADRWLEVSESSVALVQRVASIGDSNGAPIDTSTLDEVTAEIAVLRGKLAEATEFLATIQNRLSGNEEASLREQIEQAAELALRIVATLGTLDERLDAFGDRLAEVQVELRELETRTLRWVLLGTLVLTLLAAWMAAGQAALCAVGWRAWRRKKLSIASTQGSEAG